VVALGLDEGALFDKLRAEKCGFSYENDAGRLVSALSALQSDRPRLREMSRNACSLFDREFDGRTAYSRFAEFLESQGARSGTPIGRGR
jgi:hypothetical protein